MSKQRATSFPTNPPFGTTHFEHGRTWEYVEPGMWKSIGGSGGGGPGGPVTWAEVTDKPQQIEVLGVQNIITGGSF